ncbi:MAG: hypothetical protein SVX43_22720, partial [Cyanobacteriota bacterium]|nr:hypothetical protein [Cyanobacteriota bacterium]
IADRCTTMPGVLIESLNERALGILGDTLFIGSSDSIIPEFHEEYAQILAQSLQIELKSLFRTLSARSRPSSAPSLD